MKGASLREAQVKCLPFFAEMIVHREENGRPRVPVYAA